MKKFILLICISSFTIALFSQNLSSNNPKAIKYYNDGIKFYENYESLNALNKFKKATEIDPQFIEAYLLVAQIYSDLEIYDSSIVYYKKAIDIDKDFFPNAYMIIAKISYMIGKYSDAVTYQEQYYHHPKLSDFQKNKAELELDLYRGALELYNNHVPFTPANLGVNVNSNNSEYSPPLTINDITIIFTRKIPSIDNKNEQEDFFQSI
ncbi:MAG TPA: hypothetical protein PKI83_02115, partial [Bacteroidales bacterium]|nr:hypothetical protein [Bacteroidales bacterium]